MFKLLLMFLFLPLHIFAGQEVGNGGDAVLCKAVSDNSFSGFYSLDYLLTFQSSNDNADIFSVDSARQSLNRIESLIEKNLPEFSESFHEFVNMIGNRDYRSRRIWEEAPFGLVDIKDEKMIALVPTNCRTADSIQIQQVVVRQNPIFSGDEEGKELIVYKFVPSLLKDLEKTSPLQLSFLYVHEWLWDISHDVDLNRRINRFLHSKDFEAMSIKDVRGMLSSFGLRIPKDISAKEYRFDWCPADPTYAQNLLKQLASETESKILTQGGAVYGRATTCRDQPQFGCIVGDQTIYGSDTSDMSLTWSPIYSQAPFIFGGNNPTLIAFSCALDPNTAQFECSPLTTSYWSGFPRNSQVGVTGRIGANGCIRMYQREIKRWVTPNGQLDHREDNEFLFSTIIK